MPSATSDLLSLRITVVDPPPGVLWALQIGRDELVPPSKSSASGITFDFSVEVVSASTPEGYRLRGPAVQGRAGARFVYLCIGTYAGQKETPFGRRAKITLEGIDRKQMSNATASENGLLEARFLGADKKGEPACATVPLLGEGWQFQAAPARKKRA